MTELRMTEVPTIDTWALKLDRGALGEGGLVCALWDSAIT